MDPETGMFLQPDPVGPVDVASGKINDVLLTNPQRLNRYAYALNNPYKYVDPDGEFVFLAPAIPVIIVGAEALGGLAGHVLGVTFVAGAAAWMMHESNKQSSDTSSGNEDFVVQSNGIDNRCQQYPKRII